MESHVFSSLQENDFQITKFYIFHDPIEKVFEAYTNIDLLSKILSKNIKVEKMLRNSSLHDEGNEITIELLSKYKITFKVSDVIESKDYYSITLKTVFYPTTFCYFEIKIQFFWDSIEEVCDFQGAVNFEPSPFREFLLNEIKNVDFFPNKQIEEYLIKTVKNLEETESISINENINKVWEFITLLESIKYFFPLGNELTIQLENQIIIKIIDPKTKNEVVLVKKEKKEEDESKMTMYLELFNSHLPMPKQILKISLIKIRDNLTLILFTNIILDHMAYDALKSNSTYKQKILKTIKKILENSEN
jgi:hypothetical protein